jgi:hypothetical protein
LRIDAAELEGWLESHRTARALDIQGQRAESPESAARPPRESTRPDADWLAKTLADEAERPLDPHEVAIFEDSPEGREAIALANERVAAGLKPRNVRTAGWEK